MWLEPVERLGRRAVVVLRDPRVLERLADTELPVICSPYNGTLARLPLPEPLVTLFPTHSGNNLAMLRRREIRRVFVGHGDSDKPDSTNPFARVYDEIWVAGDLGRRRYDDAAVGVRADAIVEIGRPQSTPVADAPSMPTVLYAPTWEGWGDDAHHSSLAHVGPALVRRLLAEPGLRVLYRPHPLTGRRDPALRRADAEIRALLGDSAAGTTNGSVPSKGDLLDVTVASGRQRFSRSASAVAADKRERAFWAANAPDAHRVVSDLSLAACFRAASLLVADVSSVVSDWLVVDRPYAVVDTRPDGAQTGHADSPVLAGGFVLDSTISGIDDVIAVAKGGVDPTAVARRGLMSDVIGDPASAQQRFADAVTRLLGRP
jgi:hypothetical protein